MTIPEIISQMTLEEKAALLTGEDSWHIRNCPRLGMERTMVSDGPHGLRKEREDATAVYSKIVLMLSASPPPWAWRAPFTQMRLRSSAKR